MGYWDGSRKTENTLVNGLRPASFCMPAYAEEETWIQSTAGPSGEPSIP